MFDQWLVTLPLFLFKASAFYCREGEHKKNKENHVSQLSVGECEEKAVAENEGVSGLITTRALVSKVPFTNACVL